MALFVRNIFTKLFGNYLVNFYIVLMILYLNKLSENTINASRRTSVENTASLAFEHGVRVREEAECRTPRAQVVYVNTTDPSKVYLPRATLLHRCSDQTGCCPHATHTCRPVEESVVELYFFTVTLQVNPLHRSRQRVRQFQKIEKLMFTNHTLCGCRRRNVIENIDDSDNEV